MKNKIYILLSAIVIITILVICIDNDKPKKLNNIPDNAIWRGGKDGGFWFQIVNYNDTAVRFKIYNDYNGELVTDRYFSNACKGGIDINNINYYDYEKIVMMNGCELLSKNKNTD